MLVYLKVTSPEHMLNPIVNDIEHHHALKVYP